MDNPIKKKSLIPRMFRAFTVYFFITLAVFFGYVEMFGGVKTIRGTLPEGVQGEVDTTFSDFVSNMMSMQNIYIEGLDFTFEGSGLSVNAAANIAVDMATKSVFVDAGLNVNNHTYNLGVVYAGEEVFVSVDERTYKFAVASGNKNLDFSSILKVFSQALKFVDIDLSAITGIFDKLGIDLENLDMATILDQLDISTKKSEEDVKISIIFMNFLEAMIVCDQDCNMVSASVKGINLGTNKLLINLPKVEMNNQNIMDKIDVPVEKDVVDLSPINNYLGYAENLFKNEKVEADILVDVEGNVYNVKVNVDTFDSTKISISTRVEDYDVAVIYADETLYVMVEDFGVSFAVEDLKIWKDKILEIIENRTSKTVEEVVRDIIGKYTDAETGSDLLKDIKAFINKFISCSENLCVALPSEAKLYEDKFVLMWDAGIEVILSKQDDILSGFSLVCKDLLAKADFKVVDFGVAVPTNCEDLSHVLAKLENLVNYIEAGIFEFDFVASYNGLDFAGTFKYANDIYEISNVLVAGEIANIRIESGKVYFSYGNMKLKFDVPEDNNSTSFDEVRELISKLTSNAFGVEIKFGVFEELLNMIASYTLEDLKTKLVVSFGGDQNDINLSISNKKTLSLSEILKLNIKFENDKISSAKISVYDVLIAEVTKVWDVEQSTIKPFDEAEYKDYSEDFVAGALDSFEVVSNVYGFSSDIAIRYSKTTFYGELVAMVVKDEENPYAISGFVPAVSVHTTSLGLNSYIYVVGRTLYLDINGLQISADLNKTTIDEVLNFVESKFGVALSGGGNALAKGAGALSVILPAIDKIYGTWLSEFENGLQINIDDGLWYGKQSRFEDIVLQLFITDSNNIIMPAKLVVGANIYDPNTLIYDDYSDAWLYSGIDESGNKILLEDTITQNLNFGAYFTNISVGRFAESIDTVFAIDQRNYKNITSVVSNYGVTKLEDFNSYTTALTLAEVIYDYGMSMQYEISLDAKVFDENSQISLGGDVIVAVDDLNEGQTAQLDLFNGKSLKVQGNLDLQNNGTRHLIDLLYSNVDEGLYFTYTHGVNIEKGNKFKAKIENANMSEIISMLVKFANVDLGENMKKAWNIDYCTTDFSYIQALLGLEKKDVGDEISKADNALSSVLGMTKMLGLIKLEKSLGEDGLYTTTLSIQIKLNENGEPALVTLVLKEEFVDDTIVTKLRQIKVENLSLGGKTISLTLDIKDFNEASFDYDTSEAHIDFSDVSKLIDTFVTTANAKNFTFNGDVELNLLGGAGVKIEMTIDLFISIEDIKNPYVFAQVEITKGGILNVFDGSFDARMVIYEFKDGALNFHRYSKKNTNENGLIWKNYNKVVENTQYNGQTFKNSYAKAEIVPNMTEIVLHSLGIKETMLFGAINIPNMIKSIIASINVNPTVEEAFMDFTTDENCVNTTIKLNGPNLLGDGAENIDLNFGAVKYKGYTYDDKDEAVDKTYSCIDSITGLKLKMTGVNIAVNLNSNNNADSYMTNSYELRSSYSGGVTGTCGGIMLYTNRYYRMKYINSVGGVYAE